MILTAKDIESKVEAEIERSKSPNHANLMRRLLVSPRCEIRPWDYGPVDSYPCWVVGEHPSTNTAFVYCDQGFGPKHPWGLLNLSGKYSSMGMDSGWFAFLEDAVLAHVPLMNCKRHNEYAAQPRHSSGTPIGAP